MRAVVMFGVLLAISGGGWWYVSGGASEPTRQHRDKVYANVCMDVVRSTLLRPSSLEVVRSIAAPPEPVPVDVYAEPHKDVGGHDFRDLARRSWAKVRPHTVRIAVEFSAQNSGGGFSPGAAICDFEEEHPDGTPAGGAKIKKASVNGQDYGPGSREWLLGNYPAGVSLLGDVSLN